MNDTLKIGRSLNNQLVIKNEKVSGNHCAIHRLPDGDFIVEDLGSTNGTFVNGTRIMQTQLTTEDELQLGSYTLDTNTVLSLFKQPLQQGIIYDDLIKQDHIVKEFRKLKPLYDSYIKEKLRIMKENNLANTGLKAGLSLIPVVGSALGILSSTVTGNPQEQMLELEEKFKKLYICPGCYKFLGAEPFENLEKRGYCLICKTKWT